MDTILYCSILTLFLIFHQAKSDDEIAETAQNGPRDDSLKMYRYLKLYQQQQQQRLANSKAQYANRLNGGYYLPPHSELDRDYELYRTSDRWSPDEVRRYGNEAVKQRDLTPEVGQDRVKSEAPSGYISVQVYPPGEETQKNDDESTPTNGETEPTTPRTELLHENKKSQQEVDGRPSRLQSHEMSLAERNGPVASRYAGDEESKVHKNPFSDIYFIVIVAGCSAAAIFGVIAAGYCFYKYHTQLGSSMLTHKTKSGACRFQKTSKAAAEVDYPAYGVTGPSKEHTSPSGDRKLAHSAQMYHYQHQKQQMIAVENATTNRQTSNSDVDSEEENEEGDYTVYECPGLAPTGEMEVKNPLFHDDSTPMSPPVSAKEMKKP